MHIGVQTKHAHYFVKQLLSDSNSHSFAVCLAHLSVAHCWYFGCMLELDVPVGVILNGSGKTGRYGLDGVDGDISWFRNICI